MRVRPATLIPAAAAFVFSLSLGAESFAAPAGNADEAAQRGQDSSGATVYDFEDDNVDGEVLSPDGALISSRGRSKHASMITIRPHFIGELIKMARDI